MDKNKLIQSAAKFVQKGQFEKAIKEYQRVLEEDPKDVRILLKVGELHQKRGDNVLAAQNLLKVAESYSSDGFFLKAAAAYKQVLRLNPGLVDVNFKLAELYQQLGLMSDALQQFQLVATAYEQQGDAKASLAILKKLVQLDPENAANRIRLAEAYAREGMNDLAISEFTRVAEALRQNSRADEYLKVGERLAFLEPKNVGLCRELANVYLAKGDTKRALAKLQICFKNDPRDAETLTLLAHAFRDLGQTAKTVSVYKELAKVHSDNDRLDDERSVWKKILTLAPDDPEAQQWRSEGQPSSARPPISAKGSRPGFLPPPSGAIVGPDLQAQAARPREGSSPGSVVGTQAAQGPEAITRLLVETDVYLKYGLQAKAAEHVKKILAAAPGSLVAHEKAADFYLAMGDKLRGADELVRCVDLAFEAGVGDRASQHLARLKELAPARPELARLGQLLGTPVEIVEVADDAILVEAIDEEVLVAGDEPSEAGDPLAEALELAADEILDEAAADGASALDDPETIDGDEVSGFSSVSELPAELLSEGDDEGGAASMVDLGEIRLTEPVEGPGVGEPESSDLASSGPVAGPSEPTSIALPPPPAESPSGGDDLDELSELEFFVDQALWEEATELLAGLRERGVAESPAGARLLGLEQRIQAAAVAPLAGQEEPPSPTAASDDFQYSAEDVLREFRRGVERTVRPEDVETHYDLGIAYKEMGLIDEAIGEFELAAKAAGGGSRQADCFAMIGLCQGSKGSPMAAVVTFERALAVEGLKPENRMSLFYEIGVGREELGEPGPAREAFEKVAALDPNYRDVAARLERLQGAGKARKIGYL